MSHRAFRYDVVKMTGPRKDHRGYLIADAILARTGIQEYTMPDGKTRRELRPDDEVMHPDSMGTIKGSTVVNNHPPMALDANNTKQYAVGFLKGEPTKGEKIGSFQTIKDEMTIYDAKTIDDVLTKGKNQVSQGYFCDVDMTPGVHPIYGAYDAIQRNIKHNHSAIVDAGRAGPEVSIKMDSADGESVEFGMTYVFDEDGDDDGDGDGEGDDDFDEDEDDIEIDAKWSNKKKSGLPKGSFAYVDPNGKGHLPYKNEKGQIDVPHLRNALARLSQTDIPASAKAKAKAKLEAAAKKAKVGEKNKDAAPPAPPAEIPNDSKVQKKDYAEKQLTLNSEKEGEHLMIIFKLDGVEYQFDEKFDAVVTKMVGKLKELETLKADNAQIAKNLEESKADAEKLKVIVNDEKAMEARVEERIAVKAVVKEMFPEETKLDSLSTLDLQKKIVKKVNPDMDVEKQDAAFIKGMAAGVMASFKTDGTKKLEGEFQRLATDGAEAGKPTFNKDKAQKQLHSFVKNAWKQPDPAKHDKGYGKKAA